MTVESRVCPNCQEAIDASDTTCSHCGTALEGEASSWPEWHGAPSGATGEAWLVEDEEITGEDDAPFEKLMLDPGLTDGHGARRGNRSIVGVFLASAVIWFVAEIMFWGDTPASYWDAVWYVAGAITIGLGIWLLIRLWQRSRTHGLKASIRWLIS